MAALLSFDVDLSKWDIDQCSIRNPTRESDEELNFPNHFKIRDFGNTNDCDENSSKVNHACERL